MDEKHFGKTAPIFGSLPTIRKSPFSGLSSKSKSFIAYSILIFLIILALTFSAVAFFSFGNSDAPSGNQTMPALTPDNESNVSVTAPIIPYATIWYHGDILGTYKSDSSKVSDALEHFDVTLLENDVLNHPLDADIYWGMEIKVDEVTYQEVFVTEKIPFETIEVPSHNVPRGERQVIVEGQVGEVGRVLRTKFINGVEIETEATVESVSIPVINEEVHVGCGGTFTAPDGTEYSYSYYLDVVATAYTHTGNRTYSGTVAEVGVIAVDPRYIDLGSNVYVIGNYGDYGVCRAEDIGGGIKRYRIDVFLDTEEECVIFGRRNMRCYVLD